MEALQKAKICKKNAKTIGAPSVASLWPLPRSHKVVSILPVASLPTVWQGKSNFNQGWGRSSDCSQDLWLEWSLSQYHSPPSQICFSVCFNDMQLCWESPTDTWMVEERSLEPCAVNGESRCEWLHSNMNWVNSEHKMNCMNLAFSLRKEQWINAKTNCRNSTWTEWSEWRRQSFNLQSLTTPIWVLLTRTNSTVAGTLPWASELYRLGVTIQTPSYGTTRRRKSYFSYFGAWLWCLTCFLECGMEWLEVVKRGSKWLMLSPKEGSETGHVHWPSALWQATV